GVCAGGGGAGAIRGCRPEQEQPGEAACGLGQALALAAENLLRHCASSGSAPGGGCRPVRSGRHAPAPPPPVQTPARAPEPESANPPAEPALPEPSSELCVEMNAEMSAVLSAPVASKSAARP